MFPADVECKDICRRKEAGMKIRKRLRLLLAHICIIVSIVCLVTRILDWYNPYMDFANQTVMVQYILCIGAFLLGILQR